MGVYHDHSMCLTRFASECPSNVTEATDGKVELVHYNVGDVILFNDFGQFVDFSKLCCFSVPFTSLPFFASVSLGREQSDLEQGGPNYQC